MSQANFLNGDVQGQGVKIDHHAWLDMGSVQWLECTNEDKALAYQAAILCGWKDEGLKQIILKEYSPRIDQFMADITIETLQDFASDYPAKITDVYEVKVDSPVFRRNGKEF